MQVQLELLWWKTLDDAKQENMKRKEIKHKREDTPRTPPPSRHLPKPVRLAIPN